MPRRLSDKQQPKQFKTRSEWDAYSSWLIRQLRVSLGLWPAPQRKHITPEFSNPVQGDGFICERVAFETLPGFFCTGNLFRPTNTSAPTPLILNPHGHWTDGRIHDWDVRGNIVSRCIQQARMGAYAFSYDMVGYVDSCQLDHQAIPEDTPWGLGNMALHTWNSLRALDVMMELPNVDRTRIGVTGASGGGTQSYILAALDKRITAVAPICMVSYEMQGGCSCENAPLLRIHATNVEVAALAAPRPQFIASCTGDWTHNTPNSELPEIKKIYALYGEEEVLSGHHIDFEHSYNQELREHMYGFFNQVFWGAESRAALPEPFLVRPPLRERLVWYDRPTPPPISDEQLRGTWRARAQTALTPYLRNPKRITADLVPALPHVLGLDHHGESGPVENPSLQISFKDGTLIASNAPPAYKAPVDVRHNLTYNPSPLVNQVWQILGALKEQPSTTLVGENGAGPACLLAASVAPHVTKLVVDLDGFDDSDAAWDRLFPIPLLRQIGGLHTVAAALADRDVDTTNGQLPQ